jgi:TRAP-type mannitol/chloroaromatic compound transport system permease large subunit
VSGSLILNINQFVLLCNLKLMDSPLNTLLGRQLERTKATNTLIMALKNLFLDMSDVIAFK